MPNIGVMKIKKIKLFVLGLGLVALLLLQGPLYSQDSSGFNWQVGEKLVYNVTWSFFDLGQITMSNFGKTDIRGQQANHIRVEILSNPLLFWLDHKSVYNSYIGDDLKVVRFNSDENIDGVAYNGQYDFDYEKNMIFLTLFNKKDSSKITRKEIKLKPKLYDGISLIHYARVNSLQIKKDTVSTFIEDKSGDVVFNFSLSKHVTKVESFPDGINTVYFNGILYVKGIAGITGPFETWYSDDNSRVPILAFMEVFIGRVRIEIDKWKSWSPKK